MTTITDRIRFDFEFGASAPYSSLDDWQREATGYTVTIGYGRRTARFDYFTGPAITEDPTLSDVMACLVLDAECGSRDFEDFAAEMGYDTDSRRAYGIWQACQRTADKLAHLFGSDLSEVLSLEWEG